MPDILENMKELEELKVQNERYKSQVLGLEEIKENPNRMQFWTRFPNYDTFYALYEYLKANAKKI